VTESAAIMFVDDHAIVREGYRSLLQKQPRLKVVAEAGDGAEAYRLFKQTRPDLVIMDLAMPGFGGIEAIRRIRQWDPAARILVFTMHQNAAYAVPGPGPKAMSPKAVRPKRSCAPHSTCCKAGSHSAPTLIMSSR
jgi:DNA-binding NarL/FixJ family response regulator